MEEETLDIPQAQETQEDAFLEGMEDEATTPPPQESSTGEEHDPGEVPQEEAPAADLPAAPAPVPRAVMPAHGRTRSQRDYDLDQFTAHFPDAARNPERIPQEVWQAVRQGSSLSLAYALHALRQSEARSQAAELSRKNAERSTGSMGSAGRSFRPRDPFLEGWDE